MTLTSPPTTTLSRSLLLRITAVVVLCLGVFGTSFYLLVVNPAVDRLARGELSRGMSRVEGALQDNLSAVESLLKAACGWAVGGRLPIDDVRGFNGLLMPLLANDRRISSVLYADEDGNELLLLRTASGWHNRITTAGEIGKRNRILEWSEDGQLLDQAWRPSRYDPRLRPWFVGAMMQGEDHETFWTTPYRFFTTGDPGISASVRWTTAGGRTRILAFDMLLADLSALTSQLEVGRNGGVAVLTDEGSVLGLPRHTNFQDPLAVREAVLKPADRIGVRYLTDGLGEWRKLGKPANTSFTYRSDGTEWVGHFSRQQLAGDQLWVGGFARRDDFVPASLSDIMQIAALLLTAGLAGMLLALRLARRIGKPLKLLSEQSERIGRLDLTPGPPVNAPWVEINRLAAAHERMRAHLLASAREIGVAQDTTITALASLAETRDGETGNHLRRTQVYIRVLAEHLQHHPRFADVLSDENIELICKSAPLHDIGKVGIPDRILLKPGRLNDEERAVMQTHTALGRDAIQAAEDMMDARVSFLRFAKEIAYGHQEFWDGSGYPEGLKGDMIPVSARLMAVADVYDALISRRVYKPALSHAQAVASIRGGSGTHFDPDVVDAFLAVEAEFREIAERYADDADQLDQERARLKLVFGQLPQEPPAQVRKAGASK